MGIYSPGRRRAIALLLLTSILLITIDLRGNELFDAARRGFETVLSPFETAGDVISNPIQNAWNGITDYEDLAEENRRLRDENDAMIADVVAARASNLDYQQLLALNDLPYLADYDTVAAQVVGEGPTNLDQVIEINKGSNDEIEEGMTVVSPAGLVGKVTRVRANRSEIMLISDNRYTISVKIIPPAPPPTTTTSTTTTSTTTTLPAAPPDPGATTTTAAATTTAPAVATTTTLDLDAPRETGGLAGQGDGELPEILYLDNTPALGRFTVGDLVYTSGSEDSLAPPNIPIGRVVNVVDRTTSEGPVLQIEPLAELDELYFVSVVLYVPAIEATNDEDSGD